MTTLTTLTTEQAHNLQYRSRRICVVYLDQSLPTGCVPSTGRVGVETLRGDVLLHVNRGVEYRGNNQTVANWIQTGTRRFDSVDALLDWVRGWQSTENGPTSPTDSSSGEFALRRPVIAPSSELTELGSITAGEPQLRSLDQSAFLDAALASVIGQDAGVRELVESITRHSSKAFPRRPLTIMLIGPTGVGKTHSAEVVSRVLNELSGQNWGFFRLDMSEFSERHSTSRLIGAPPGYIGYGDDTLAARLATNPRHVVLFDEIDKAHPEVVMALMNLMDAGRLDSTRHGEVTAQQAILLFTSNLGANSLVGSHRSDGMTSDQTGREHLLGHGMAPELVGRFSRVLVFQPLRQSAIASVSARAIATVAADYGHTVTSIEPAYISGLLELWADRSLGVRALEHIVDSDLGSEFGALPAGSIHIRSALPRVVPDALAAN